MMPNSSAPSLLTTSSSTSSLDELQLKTEADSIGEAGIPSELVLRSIKSRVLKSDLEQATSMSTTSTTPAMLALMMKSWVIDKDTMQLVMTSQVLRDEVQELCRSMLQPAAAELPAPSTAGFQTTVNHKPEWVQMGSEGEQIFKASLKLKTSAATVDDYTSSVLQLFGEAMASNNVPALRSVTTGIGLALGGTTMTAANRDAMLDRILDSSANRNADQMAAMIHGLCSSFGYRDVYSAFLQSVMKRILGSSGTGNPPQTEAMLQSLGDFLGGVTMSPDNRDGWLQITLSGYSTGRDQFTLTVALQTLWLVLGGKDMSPANRDAILSQVLQKGAAGSVKEKLQPVLSGMFGEPGGENISAEVREAMRAAVLATLEAVQSGGRVPR